MENSRLPIGKEIRAELLRQRRGAQWLAERLGCNRTNIYNIFARDGISTDLLMKISIALNRDFFALYSQQLNKLNADG